MLEKIKTTNYRNVNAVVMRIGEVVLIFERKFMENDTIHDIYI